MSFAIAGAALATVGGAYLASDAAGDAADTQRGAARDASAVQQNMFNQVRRDQLPYMQAGYGAQDMLSHLLGIAPRTASGTPDVIPDDIVRSNNGVPEMNSDLYASDPAYRTAWDRVLANEQATRPGWGGQSTYFQQGNEADFSRLTDAITREMMAYRDANPSEAGRINNQGRTYEYRPDGTLRQVVGLGPGGQDGSAGQGSAQTVDDRTGLPFGYLTQTFGPDQFRANMDPGYGFRVQQGTQALRNQLAPNVGSMSGAAIKDLINFNQGAASQEYGAAFDRFQTQQGNIFQRLLGIASQGQNAAAGVGQQGVATGGNIGANIIGAGNAAAAGQIGQANAWSGALGDLGSLAWLASRGGG